MKPIMLTMALMLSMTAAAEEKNDTTVSYHGKQFVIEDDTTETKVSVLTLDGGTLKKSRETTYVDNQEIERIYVTSPFTPTSYTKNPFGMTQPTFWFGWRRMSNKSYGNWGETEGLHTKDGGSFEIGLTLGELTIPLWKKDKYGLSAALQCTYERQYFQDNAQPYNEGRRLAFNDNSQSPAANNYLHYATVRVPILLLVSDDAHLFNHFTRLQGGTGIAVEYRTDSRFHYMPGSFGDPMNEHARINHWGLQATASISVGSLKITASHDLLPLFKTTDGHKGYGTTIALGITIGELLKKK